MRAARAQLPEFGSRLAQLLMKLGVLAAAIKALGKGVVPEVGVEPTRF